MSSNKKNISILLVLGIFAFSFFAFKQKTEAPKVEEKIVVSQKEDSKQKEGEIKKEELLVQKNIEEKSKLTEQKISSEVASKVSISIDEKVFSQEVVENASVYEVLNNVNKKGEVNFLFKEFSGLGFFVEAINGVKSGNGKYWIYYINGKKATIGISNYKVKDGDNITWKLEAEL